MAKMSEEQFEAFLRQCNNYLRTCIDQSEKEFRLSTYERFDWDQWRGELVFSNGGIPMVVAQIQFVGTISTQSNTWLWAWANRSYLEPLRWSSSSVRDFGKENGLTKLTTANWAAEEVDGWEMTAIAARLTEARGAYRSPRENGFTFMIFTDLRGVTDRDAVFATFSCSHVVEKKLPVLYVHKESNGDVQLLCGGVHKSVKTGRVINLGDLLDWDDTLNELADLPLGWIAQRDAPGKPWKRSQDSGS
jgi:hypothetical protein